MAVNYYLAPHKNKAGEQPVRISNQWTPGTMECWNAFRKHLAAQGKNIQFDHFNDDGINAFVRYLRVKAKMAPVE